MAANTPKQRKIKKTYFLITEAKCDLRKIS